MKNCNNCNKEYTNIGAYKKHIKGCIENEVKIKIIDDYVNNLIPTSDLMIKYNLGKAVIYKILEGKMRTFKEAQEVSLKKFKEHNEESKKKISKSMMGNRNANHRGDRQSFYNDIRMDSSWEVKVAKYLDENNYNWEYATNRYLLSTGQYIHPDFFIINDKKEVIKVIEVKGYFREKNKFKFELFLNEYPELIVELWNKQILKEKKII